LNRKGVPSVQARQLAKWFGPVVALSEVSFDIGPGVTALLGPNGSGKSTLMRLLCGLAAPSRGTVRVFGEDPRSNPALARRIGIAPQGDRPFERESLFGFVRTAAVLCGLENPEAAALDAIDAVELDPADKRPLGSFSKGMRQRAKLAQAIVGDPDLLILDEPLEGLDPRQRAGAIALIGDLTKRGKTVVVSSHVLEEVERFGSRILVIAQGRILAEGPYPSIRELLDDRPHRIRVVTDRPGSLAASLLQSGAVSAARVKGPAIEVESSEVAAFRRSVARAARECGAHLTEVLPLDDDLESVFGYLVAPVRDPR
jgi:ABC-2 type transport system ATP-binding protein